MNSTSSEPAGIPDPFEEAALEAPKKSAPEALTEAAAPALDAPKVYPPFHPDEYRDNPFASGINDFADSLAKMPEGSASKDNLGESMVYAFECYSGHSTGQMPPYMHVVIAGTKYSVHVFIEKKTGGKGAAEEEQRADDAISQRLAAANKEAA